MNDAREIQYGISLLREAIHAAIERHPDGEKKDRLNANMAFILPPDSTRYTYFAASFCVDGDQLSQWCGYGRRGGYAIGFPATTLARAVATNRWLLGRVEYQPEKQQALAALYAEEFIDRFDRWASPNGDVDGPWEVADMNLSAIWLAMLLKDYAFRDEQEWRLCSQIVGRSEVRFRDSAYGVSPYYPLRLDDETFDELRIIVGPCPHPETARAAVDLMMRTTEPKGRVTNSAIPFRDW